MQSPAWMLIPVAALSMPAYATAYMTLEDIKNISRATLSCRHVTETVKRLLATYEIALKSS